MRQWSKATSDPDRLGVMGFNLGGYATCCIVTRTERFRAAVAVDPFTNLISWPHAHIEGNHLGWLEHAKEHETHLGGTIWEVPEQYVENSPLFHLHRVTTPLLLLHGTENPIPISQSEEIYAGLRRLGKVATLVRYYGRGDGPVEVVTGKLGRPLVPQHRLVRPLPLSPPMVPRCGVGTGMFPPLELAPGEG